MPTEDMDWRLRGACRGAVDPDLWFPLSYKGMASREQVAEARAVCIGCAVRSTCLEWSIETGQADGIWGGLTPDERPRPAPRKGGKPKPSEVDEVVVARAIAGKPVGRKLRKEERVAVADTMLAAGRTLTAAAMAVGCSNTTMRGLVAS